MKRAKQTSESIELGILLALSGGFMDAYSYLARGQVFANAQTGNMLLFGVNLARGQFQHALHYLCPVLAFGLGIFLAEFVHFQKIQKVHWRQVTLLIEIIILFGVGYISFEQNLLANSLTSFACGLQVQAFRKIHGKGYATTMCIGNLRTGTHEMCNYLCTKKSPTSTKWTSLLLNYFNIYNRCHSRKLLYSDFFCKSYLDKRFTINTRLYFNVY